MRRNRSIRALPAHNLTFGHPAPEKLCFGEAVFDRRQVLSSDDSDVLSGVRDVGSKGSSSSLSWGDDGVSEASRRLRDELARMDRVLRGAEPVPEHYDRDEYEEWMRFFPSLCVVGVGIGAHEAESEAAETAPSGAIDVDSFLKVAPMGASRLPRRQSSSRSLISSHISSSKWLKDEEYESLPFIAGVRKVGAPRSILKNSLVLPPIEGSQFRSVSATPRRESKSLSALSMKDQKYSGFKRKNI